MSVDLSGATIEARATRGQPTGRFAAPGGAPGNQARPERRWRGRPFEGGLRSAGLVPRASPRHALMLVQRGSGSATPSVQSLNTSP